MKHARFGGRGGGGNRFIQLKRENGLWGQRVQEVDYVYEVWF
jgi:hypothetical protein